MEIKPLVCFKSVKNDREYSFIVPHAAPYGETYDVLFELMTKVNEMVGDETKKIKEAVKPQNDYSM